VLRQCVRALLTSASGPMGQSATDADGVRQHARAFCVSLRQMLSNTVCVSVHRLQWNQITSMAEVQLNAINLYRVIQKDGFNFVCLYFKIRTGDKYDVQDGREVTVHRPIRYHKFPIQQCRSSWWSLINLLAPEFYI
jgi:hypothetical protein